MKNKKLYKVKLEYRIKDTIEVEAENEDEAKNTAMDQIEISGCIPEFVDYKVKVIDT